MPGATGELFGADLPSFRKPSASLALRAEVEQRSRAWPACTMAQDAGDDAAAEPITAGAFFDACCYLSMAALLLNLEPAFGGCHNVSWAARGQGEWWPT